jgi:hypothetical protein
MPPLAGDWQSAASGGHAVTARELPLRVVEDDGMIILTSLCGAESGVIRMGLANSTMVGLRSSGAAMPRVSPDLTPAAILRMVLHARGCLRCQNLAAEGAVYAAATGTAR